MVARVDVCEISLAPSGMLFRHVLVVSVADVTELFMLSDRGTRDESIGVSGRA